MASPPFLLLLSTTLLLLPLTSATTVGITYNPSANASLPPPELVVNKLCSMHVSAVHILNPTPASVRAFSYTNISVLLTVPNNLLPSFAANLSASSQWLFNNVLPFHPRTKISIISVGSNPISDPDFEPSTTLLPAILNLRQSLIDLGIKTIPVSTTFNFISIITKSFPPSSAEFIDPASLFITPVLQFLEETNSSFLVNLYPYNVFRSHSEIPVAFAIFQEHPFNFRDDLVTGVRYWNLFDMMVDSVVAAMAVIGKNVPVIVAQTGWPSNEAHGEGNYAELYLKGLVSHLRSGLGTPLRKEGAAEVYVYQMFDDNAGAVNLTKPEIIGVGDARQEWGIMYPNMTSKYHFSFSGSVGKMLLEIDYGAPVILVSILLLHFLFVFY